MYGYGRRIENEIIVHMAPRVDWLYGECMTEEKIKSVTPGAVLQVFSCAVPVNVLCKPATVRECIITIYACNWG